uniref:Uncharacterized protein n=1 Tax=Oryza rufipogon TaxID=4529 RepID=A0A0E0MTR0_ORYRU
MEEHRFISRAALVHLPVAARAASVFSRANGVRGFEGVICFEIVTEHVSHERLSLSRERKTSVSPNFLPLVGVDLRAKEVLEYETHKMTVPENARVFPYGLLPMVLPPALSAARMTPPPSSPTWVFLNRKAHVCGGEGGDSEPVLLQGADDVSLELAAPPRESVLTVSPRVLLGDVSVLALDPSAGLVLPVLGDDGEDDDTMFVSCGYNLATKLA